MYYPKSQIQTDLYTTGGEYVFLSTKEQYIGFYWKTSSGKFFSGKTPQDPSTQELIISIPSFPPSYNQQSNINLLTLYPTYDPDPDIDLIYPLEQ